VPREAIDKAVKYVKGCQDIMQKGGFSYQYQRGVGQFGAAPGFARTALALVALHNGGVRDGAEVKKGLDFLMRYKPSKDARVDPDARVHFFYGHYYAGQAFWFAGGRHWHDWFPAVRDELLRTPGHRQRAGNWHDNAFCTHFCTAMALLTLQIPNNYLPTGER
jgi:hypothetical protein